MWKKMVFFAAVTAALFPAAAGVTPVKAATAPVIDGKLDDACWRQAPAFSDFTLVGNRAGKKAERRTEARIVYTDTAIVFGVRNYVPAAKLPQKDDPKEAVFRSDCIEIMLTPSGDTDNYYHFIVNSFNRTYEQACEQGGYVGDEQWQCDYRSAVHRDKDFWSMELELPYSSLALRDATAKFWRVNLQRESYALPGTELEVSSTSGGGHDAKAFANIPAPPVDLSRYCWRFDEPAGTGAMRDGKQLYTLKTTVENRTGRRKKVNAEVLAAPLNGGATVRANSELTLEPGQPTAVEFKPVVLPASGRYRGKITLRDSDSNRILLRRFFECAANFTPMAIELVDPHYRDAIFVTQKLDKVRGVVKLSPSEAAAAGITVAIRQAGGKEIARQKFPGNAVTAFEFDNAALPFGRLELCATAVAADGKVLAESVKPLRKLEYKPWEMWCGKDGIWRRDGKPFFMLGLWSGGDPEYMTPDFNLLLTDRPLRPGQWRMNLLFSGKNMTALRKDGVTDAVVAAFRKNITARIDNPEYLLHYFMDEPDCSGQTSESMAELGAKLADADPWRPLLISTASNGMIRFMECAELNGFHTYHRTIMGKPMANFSKMGIYLDAWRAAYDAAPNRAKQGMLWLHQGFCYGDSGLQESRIPSYEEYRNQNLYALIMGNCGILQYNRNERQFPELYLGIPALTRELRIVGNEAIIQPDSAVRPRASARALRLLAKHNSADNAHWLLAGNASDAPAEYEIEFAPFDGKTVQVLSEARTVKFSGGKLKETFTPWQVKVYTDSPRKFDVTPIAATNAAIESEYARRVKPGNLAYQRFDGDAVKVYASSNKFKLLNNENSLWHLADGVTAGPVCVNPHRAGIVVSQDNTPGETPDWIEMVFRKPVRIGRVVVYPAENSLKDYELQLERDGRFVTVAAVKDAQGTAQEHKFAPETTTKIRIFVTANRGPHTRLYEIGAYEK